MKILKTDCLSDGFRMPGEFEKQDGCLMIYPWRPGSWNYKVCKRCICRDCTYSCSL